MKFMSNYYKLGEDGQTPVRLKGVGDELTAWKQDRTVKKDKIVSHGEDITVSTVFLAIDHSYGGGPPILFETMIFGGERDGYQDRYATWEEALEGHGVALALAKGLTLENL